MKPRKRSAITTLIFQRARAPTTIEPETSVITAARFAVLLLMPRVPALPVEAFNPDARAIRRPRLSRRAPPRRRARAAAGPCPRARRARDGRLRGRLAGLARGPRPPGDRRGARDRGRLALGPHPG